MAADDEVAAGPRRHGSAQGEGPSDDRLTCREVAVPGNRCGNQRLVGVSPPSGPVPLVPGRLNCVW